jgi:hypothetical protein
MVTWFAAAQDRMVLSKRNTCNAFAPDRSAPRILYLWNRVIEKVSSLKANSTRALGPCQSLSYSDPSIRCYKLKRVKKASLRMRSHPAAFRTGKSEVQPAERHFSLEMERQILEIQEAFELFIGDCERQKRDTENRLRETERQKKDIEDRLRAVERQKQAVEDQLRDAGLQLRKLQETLPARIIRCLRKSNLSRTARERIQ